MLKLFLSALVSLFLFNSIDSACVNKFSGRPIVAAGDWNSISPWDAASSHGTMYFDDARCVYTLSVGGLTPNNLYKWKVALDNAWKENYGCNNADCVFKSNSDGAIRLIFDPAGNRLSVEQTVDALDFIFPAAPCIDKFTGRVVTAAGDFSLPTWNALDAFNQMSFDSESCSYVLILDGLKSSSKYVWKVVIDGNWKENFGLNGALNVDKANADFTASAEGRVRLIFKLNPVNLLSDLNLEPLTTVVTKPGDTTTPRPTPAPTTPGASVNPSKPCTLNVCPSCTNSFSSKLVRVTGDWPVELGSLKSWDAAEPLGLLTYDQDVCAYVLVVKGLKPSFEYKFKVTIDNSWKENYGCGGTGDCAFKTNGKGAVRFVVKSSPLQLTTDYNVAPCGDGICEDGETCRACSADCGQCPPPVCGDDICEEGETFVECPSDCSNELPGCDRFSDEGCRAGDQFHANSGVEKRRWQTPKPGAKNYQASYQDNYALVGYADIRYTSTARTEADVCIIATHKNKVVLTYYFNGEAQAGNCKKFSSSHKSTVALKVTGSDGTQLVIHEVTLYWNRIALANRAGDYRNGQKGAVAEFFGWPHKDVEQECEILAKAGYLGAKLFPVHEHLMSTQPFENTMNPWYFMYQPVSYKLEGRAGTREELQSLIDKCRSLGVRIYVDAVLNHFVGAGNDMLDHRNPSAGCTKWGNKTTTAIPERQSPFYTHAYTYKYNPNTGEPPSNEFPGAAIGPEDFHCDRILGSWSDLFVLNNGWLVGLTDLDTSRETVRERQAAYLVEMISMGVSGFRLDAAKHMSPEDISGVIKKVQTKMGGALAEDFFVWLEIITGGEANLIWSGQSWYGSKFDDILRKDLGTQTDIDKIKLWDGLYPKEPFNNPAARNRVVIQNDDHDQQNPGSSSRDMGPFGCVLVKNCPEGEHRNYEVKLFDNPNGVGNNDNDWPIRFILSSYYHTYGNDGIPDGLSDCSLCTVTCASCKHSVPRLQAYQAGECAYKGKGYTRVHRDVTIINAMRKWMKLGPISGGDIGLPGC